MKIFLKCLTLSLILILPSLGYSKNPPCVQWYGSCQKQLYWQVPYKHGKAVNIYSLTMDYEVLNEDGSVQTGTLKSSATTKNFGSMGYFAAGIPNFFAMMSGKAAIRDACKQMEDRLRSAVCE